MYGVEEKGSMGVAGLGCHNLNFFLFIYFFIYFFFLNKNPHWYNFSSGFINCEIVDLKTASYASII